ncbi:MAG: biotin/lipoyl-containing protein, partial [Candidatus Brocadiia bacterium]
MAHPVYLPQLGQTMEEGTIERWHKQEGDTVQKGEVLYELTTDKATLEVESFASGVLRKVVAAEGQTVPVNALVAVIAEADEEIPEDLLSGAAEQKEEGPQEAAERPAPAEEPGEPAARAPGRPAVSPRARKLAGEQKVPLAPLKGSGPGGRIIERDVQAYLKAMEQVRATPAACEAAHREGISLVELARTAPDRRLTLEDVLTAAPTPPGRPAGEQLQLTPMRQTIARRMAESKQTIPHFYLTMDVRMDAAMGFLEQLRQESDQKITLPAVLLQGQPAGSHEHGGHRALLLALLPQLLQQ